MRHLLITLFVLVFSNIAFGQDYVFDTDGTMKQSQFYIDTAFKTDLKLQNKIIFQKLNSKLEDSINLKKYIPKQYDFLINDTLEYFVIINLTNKEIKLKRIDDRLVIEAMTRYENFGFKPINYFIYPNDEVGLNYDDLSLSPSEVLIIKNNDRKIPVDLKQKPYCVLRLLTSSNGILFSKKYVSETNGSNHYINIQLKKDFDFKKLAFPNQ
ncbi:MAG TPA: hypothetical protein VK718_06065 [Ferruginibacter sp.]|jgi:hypothetical protein|nr:hypothetical protein [Ferruginibacter sp.]